MPPTRPAMKQEALFPSADFESGAPLHYKELSAHLWTTNKAKFIARYLREFVFVTKHGTYVDVFAGRQSEEAPDGWAAEQVLAMQPRTFKLRHYRWFEKDEQKLDELESLKAAWPEVDITV